MSVQDLDAELQRIAGLARLELASEEQQRLFNDLGAILAYMRELDSLDTSSVEGTTHVVPLDCPLRADGGAPDSAAADAILEQAPRLEQRHFAVPRIIEP